MENLKKIIIVMCILVVVIIVIVLMVFGNKKSEEETVNIEQERELDKGNGNQEYVVDSSIKKVSDKTRYYAVKNMITQYFDYINMIITDASTELDEEDTELALSALMNIISKDNIDELKLTQEKFLSKDFTKYIGCVYHINEMYMIEKTSTLNIFFTNVDIDDTNETLSFIVVTDWSNMAFEIYTNDYIKKHGYQENIDSLEELNVDSVEKNVFNKIGNVHVTDRDVAVDYFNNYKYKMLNNLEDAYMMLDENYKKERFADINEYKQYINENIQYLREIQPEEYLYNEYEDYNEYVCKDQYENLYIFKETAIMDYTIQLDTYTIMTDKFMSEYTQGNENKKVIMNIDKFIQMINNYDYKSAYEVLNDTFKENNFKDLDSFKQYMQNTYYRYNDITLGEYTEQNEVYVYKTTITNKENSEETKDMNFVMKLNNGTDFELSFEIINNTDIEG